MAMFYVERQPWQHWPKKLVVVRKVDGEGKDERRWYVPEKTCHLIRKKWGDPLTGLYVTYECDKCGYVVKRVERFVQHTLPNYCQNCGCRVTERRKEARCQTETTGS